MKNSLHCMHSIYRINGEEMLSKYKYEYIPNEFAKRIFNLKAKKYSGTGMTPLFQKTFGEENYDKYFTAGDPLCDKDKGNVVVIINKPKIIAAMNNEDRSNFPVLDIRTIGTVSRRKAILGIF